MSRKAVSIVVLIVLLATMPPLVFAAKFNFGDTVEVFNTGASGLVVRDAPAGNAIGKKYDGDRGVVIAGPQNAYLGGVLYTWWKVRWASDSLEGWSAENWLMRVPPDLTVEDIWIYPESFNPGSAVTIYTRIRNIGAGAAVSGQGLWINAYFDGGLCYQEGIEGLGAGYAYTFQWGYTWPSNTNWHTIEVRVDPSNYIIESNEGNNIRSESFQAIAPPSFDFTLGVSPSSGSVQQGGSISATVTVALASGSTQTATLTASGLPSGAYATFSPSSGYPTFTSTFTISTSTTTPTGTFYITIIGSGGGLTRTATYALTMTPLPVPDFSISASPTSLSIQQGSSGSSTITITSINGFNQPVQLSVSGAPSGVTPTPSPSQVTPPAGGTATSTLTVSVGTTATPGSYTLTVTGTSATLTHNTYISLQITTLAIFEPKLSIPVYAPTLQQAHPGTVLTFIINVANHGTVTDTIELSASGTVAWTIQLSESLATLGPSQSNDVYLYLTTGDDPRNTITVKGTSQGDPSKTSSCQVEVQPFSKGQGLLNVQLKFSNKDTQSHTLWVIDVPDYVKLSATQIFLSPSGESWLNTAFDPMWWNMHTEPGLNSFSLHIVDLETAKGAWIPVKFDEYVVIATSFDLSKDSYSFPNGQYGYDTCYGMAATSILYFERVQPTYELGKDEAGNEIRRYQGDMKNFELGVALLKRGSPDEAGEYQKLVESIRDWDQPIILAVYWGGLELHAVVAYKIVEVDNKAYILCYDNERPYSSLSDPQSFIYAIYDKTTQELNYYGEKCEFLVYEPTENIISTQRLQESWFAQVVRWIASHVNAVFHCPVNVTITDQYGRVISDNGTNQIPDATFISVNETKYFCLPLDLTYNISIIAYDVGNFTLMIVKPLAGSSASIDIYENVYVTFGAQATLEIIQYQMNQTMKIDTDGDGVIDELRNPSVSETIYIPLLSYTFSIVWGEQTFIVSVESNSTVSNFAFNQPTKEISFNATGLAGTIGFCNVTIPKTLLYGEPWTVLIEGVPVPITITENATHTSLYFTYAHSTHTVQIIGTWVIGPPSDTTLPLIQTPLQQPEPDKVTLDKTVIVYVNVTDMESGVKSVILSYTTNGGATWNNLTMLYNATTALYQATIPAFPSGTNICYKIIAYDNADNVAINDNTGQYYCYTVNPPAPPPLLVSISPLSASILVGQSVTFTSTVSGGYLYSYQWYLNGNPVSGATSASWTFTPTASGIYYVHLKVTDDKGNTAQSDAARVTAATVPVGGYSFRIQVQTKTEPTIPYIAFIAALTAIFTKLRRKTKRKH